MTYAASSDNIMSAFRRGKLKIMSIYTRTSSHLSGSTSCCCCWWPCLDDDCSGSLPLVEVVDLLVGFSLLNLFSVMLMLWILAFYEILPAERIDKPPIASGVKTACDFPNDNSISFFRHSSY